MRSSTISKSAEARPARRSGARAQRPTIALLIDYMTLFAGGYEKVLRDAFHAVASRQGVDLLCVYGRPLSPADASYAAHNAVYDLLHPERVDGIVALSASLSSVLGEHAVRSLLQRFEGMALCSVGVRSAGTPSLIVDNRSGMEAAVSHLIREHGARRLAFIRGPADNVDAQERFEAYLEVLARHSLRFDPDLVGQGDFVRRSGEWAAHEILARAGKPDAVIAANDAMALGAINALKVHGFRVPEHVLVTGFDDLEQARLADPPLTTVGQPLMAIAEQAMQIVLEQLSGSSVSECHVLAAQFISRESCGCNGRGAHGSSAHHHPVRRDWRTELRRVDRVFAEDPSAGELRRLLDAVGAQLEGEPHALLSAVEALLREAGDDNEYHQRLQGSITRLREELRDIATPELEDLWHDARTRIALVSTQTQVQLRLEHDEMYHRLIEHGERLNKARDLVSLKNLLEETLPGLGITDASISRARKSDTSELELFVGLKGGVPYQGTEPRFSAYDLFPPEAEEADRRRTWLLLPLVFETHNLGVAAFEYSRQMSSGWQVIRDQISAALRSLALHDEIVENTTRHERSIQEQERAATAKRIQSLSVLAGGVAHDLNNVLGPLVALPDVILEELQKLASDPALVEVRSDVETIRSAALRAAQTIKDLLTLSRQGQAAKEPLELNRIVADCISQDGLRFSAERKPPISIQLELFDEPLGVCASASHLTRAIANLLRNAAEAIRSEGVIHIRTERVRLAHPLTGYETVEAGEYAVLCVSDSGNGIPKSEIGRIFEPFFSSKKLGEDSGSGLGLAIVHGVVKEHGGFINVESTPGRGTTFTLYFPTVALAPIAPVNEVQAHRGKAKVLVVDDEPVQLRTAHRILTVLGYQVDTLRSGVEAYRRFEEARKRARRDAATRDAVASPYELVILDMMLGEERDGLEVLQDIVRLFPSQRAIIASGHASTERTTAAMSRAVLWLPKPYTSSALARAVEEALSSVPGRRSAPPSVSHRRAASASKSQPPSSTE